MIILGLSKSLSELLLTQAIDLFY